MPWLLLVTKGKKAKCVIRKNWAFTGSVKAEAKTKKLNVDMLIK